MKFHIGNFALLGAVLSSSCAAPEKAEISLSMPLATVAPLPTGTPGLQRLEAIRLGRAGILVFQRKGKPIAVKAGQKTLIVLRDNFAVKDWNMAPNGSKLCFAETPSDVDFFDAGAIRSYLFTANFNSKQNVLLAAYGKKSVPAETSYGYSFGSSTWGKDGRMLLVTQTPWGWYGNEPGPTPSYSQIALFDARTRRQLWNSNKWSKKISQLVEPDGFVHLDLFNGAVSSDGGDVVCGAAPFDGSRQPTSVAFLVHFNFKRKTGEVLTRLFQTGGTFSAVWHPTQKRLLFVGPTSPKDPTRNLFAFDLKAKKMTRLTNGAQDDFSPQWSLDGKQILWIRGSVYADKAGANRIWRADADGSNARAILPQIAGVTQIQLLPKIADWARYRKLSIEPLAGKDK